MERKKNPLSFDFNKYLNSVDSYKLTFDEWKIKNIWEDPDQCDRCGEEKGDFGICPKCKF